MDYRVKVRKYNQRWLMITTSVIGKTGEVTVKVYNNVQRVEGVHKVNMRNWRNWV